jgi:hypothetical protein
VISILIMTFRRVSDVYYIPPSENRITPGLVYSIISLVLGWWGVPLGFIYTPDALYENFTGGINVTGEVVNRLYNAYSVGQ